MVEEREAASLRPVRQRGTTEPQLINYPDHHTSVLESDGLILASDSQTPAPTVLSLL